MYRTNTLARHAQPWALLKAMLINGARADGNYTFTVTNDINFQGWGLPNIQNSVPPWPDQSTQRPVFRACSSTKARPTRWQRVTASHFR